MKRNTERGLLFGSILTVVSIIGDYFIQGYINLQSIGISIIAGIISSVIISIVFITFSPGEVIPEGDEDKYIKD